MNSLSRNRLSQWLPRPCIPTCQFFQSISASTLLRRAIQTISEATESTPPYPYGPARWYKKSNKGLFGGQTIQFGNNVSKITKTKTRRAWRPNVQNKKMWSEALGRHLKLKITTRVLRTIDKCGGLDEYLLGEKSQRIKELGVAGWRLRWRIMQTPWYAERRAQQAKELGLSEQDIEKWDKRNEAFRRTGEWKSEVEGEESTIELADQAEDAEEVIDLTGDRSTTEEDQEVEEKIQFMAEQPSSGTSRPRS